ncbi:MAG: hypothetical protein FJW56_07110 [Actinobacteria bacterium]|nr:hypothetical protein [Actinomycetota bacterium]
MKFIADIMVGKLAKYLRMSGNDVVYINDINDDDILKIAVLQNRIILTRDTLMLKRKECRTNQVKSILINDDKLINQLKQIKKELQINLKPNLIRCIDCNTALDNVKKEDIEGKIPPYVYKTQKYFLYCRQCDKYYWRGTHYTNINNTFKILNK